jgi:hypothetical protein
VQIVYYADQLVFVTTSEFPMPATTPSPFQVISERIPSKGNAKAQAQKREYHPIADAAAIVGCSSRDLLHLGALNVLDLCAPLLNFGNYTWLVGPSGHAFPHIETPLLVELSRPNLVILLPADLQRIELVGSAVVKKFYAPDLAAKVLPLWTEHDYSEYVKFESEKRANREATWRKILEDPEIVLDDERCDDARFFLEMESKLWAFSIFITLQENAHNSPWFVSDIDDSALQVPTHLENLHVEQAELVRLIENGAQPTTIQMRSREEEKIEVHGNKFVNMRKDHEILLAATYTLYHNGAECRKSHRAWCTLIEQHSDKFWTEGQPPRGTRHITDLLAKAIQLPKNCT